MVIMNIAIDIIIKTKWEGKGLNYHRGHGVLNPLILCPEGILCEHQGRIYSRDGPERKGGPGFKTETLVINEIEPSVTIESLARPDFPEIQLSNGPA